MRVARFPLELESKKQGVNLYIESASVLRTAAKKYLRLSNGFIQQCSNEEILDFFLQRGFRTPHVH